MSYPTITRDRNIPFFIDGVEVLVALEKTYPPIVHSRRLIPAFGAPDGIVIDWIDGPSVVVPINIEDGPGTSIHINGDVFLDGDVIGNLYFDDNIDQLLEAAEEAWYAAVSPRADIS